MKYKKRSNILYIILVISLIITMSVLAHFYVKDRNRQREYTMITQAARENIDNDNNNKINENMVESNMNITPPYQPEENRVQNNTFIYSNTSVPTRSPQEQNALDRVYNPLRYPYKIAVHKA